MKQYIYVIERYYDDYLNGKYRWSAKQIFPDWEVETYMTRQAAEQSIKDSNKTFKTRIVKYKRLTPWEVRDGI